MTEQSSISRRHQKRAVRSRGKDLVDYKNYEANSIEELDNLVSDIILSDDEYVLNDNAGAMDKNKGQCPSQTASRIQQTKHVVNEILQSVQAAPHCGSSKTITSTKKKSANKRNKRERGPSILRVKKDSSGSSDAAMRPNIALQNKCEKQIESRFDLSPDTPEADIYATSGLKSRMFVDQDSTPRSNTQNRLLQHLELPILYQSSITSSPAELFSQYYPSNQNASTNSINSTSSGYNKSKSRKSDRAVSSSIDTIPLVAEKRRKRKSRSRSKRRRRVRKENREKIEIESASLYAPPKCYVANRGFHTYEEKFTTMQGVDFGSQSRSESPEIFKSKGVRWRNANDLEEVREYDVDSDRVSLSPTDTSDEESSDAPNAMSSLFDCNPHLYLMRHESSSECETIDEEPFESDDDFSCSDVEPNFVVVQTSQSGKWNKFY